MTNRTSQASVSPHHKWFLFWAVITALIVRLVVVIFVYQDFLVPGRDHWEFGYELGQLARSIATGQGFANPFWVETGPTSLEAPVFPYFVASIFAIFGVWTKVSALVLLSLNSLFSALTCVPIFLVARFSFGLRTAKWAAWLWALFPYAINFSANSMWDHSFIALLLSLIFLFALHLQSSDRILAWVAFGMLYGFAALTSPVILGILPFLGGWICYRLARQKKHWMKAATAGALAVFAMIAPWMVRNIQTFHRPVFLQDNFWMEVCVGNQGNSLHWWNGDVHPAGSAAEMEEYQRLGEIGYMAERRHQAFAWIKSHPGTYLYRSIRRIVFVWTGFWSFGREYLHEEPLDLANVPLLTVITILAGWGLYKAFRSAPEIAMPYFLVLLFYPAAYYLTHPDPGYRHPLDPLLVILLCYGLVSRSGGRVDPRTGSPAPESPGAIL